MYISKGNVSLVTIIVMLSACVLSCNKSAEKNEESFVECYMCRIEDSQSNNLEQSRNTRHVRFYYVMTNRTESDVFIPFNSDWSLREDSLYCSRINLLIDNHATESLLRTSRKWNSVLKANDSVYIELKILGGLLRSLGIDERIDVLALKDIIKLKYDPCLSDTFYSRNPIPKVVFTEGKEVIINKRETIDSLINEID